MEVFDEGEDDAKGARGAITVHKAGDLVHGRRVVPPPTTPKPQVDQLGLILRVCCFVFAATESALA